MKLVKNFVFAVLLACCYHSQHIRWGTRHAGLRTTAHTLILVPEDGTSPTERSLFEQSGETTAETTDYLFFETLQPCCQLY